MSVSIFEQLTLPVRDGQIASTEQKINIQQSDTDTIVNSSDAALEINVRHKIFIRRINNNKKQFLENFLQNKYRKLTIVTSW